MTYRNSSEIFATVYSYVTFVMIIAFTIFSYYIANKVYALTDHEILWYKKYEALFEGIKRSKSSRIA